MYGSVYTERRRENCNAATKKHSDLILRFLSKASELLLKWIATPIDQVYSTSIVTDTDNQSLILSVNMASRTEVSFALFTQQIAK